MDLAAATKKTAAAIIEWTAGAARLVHLSLNVSDDAIVELFGSTAMTGIDCPVGWPDALLPFIAGHLNFERSRSWSTTGSKAAGSSPTATPTASSPGKRA
ncbi:conserved hypothetical protein [Arthrobacter sp. Hiyo6]|nr:conserved hypothetical protein [Arthrobacter sp. Hiyo6]